MCGDLWGSAPEDSTAQSPVGAFLQKVQIYSEKSGITGPLGERSRQRGRRYLPKLNSNVCVVGLQYSKLQAARTLPPTPSSPSSPASASAGGSQASRHRRSPFCRDAAVFPRRRCPPGGRERLGDNGPWEATKLPRPVALRATGATRHPHADLSPVCARVSTAGPESKSAVSKALRSKSPVPPCKLSVYVNGGGVNSDPSRLACFC